MNIWIDSCGDGYASAEVAAVWDEVSIVPPVVEAEGGRNATKGLKCSSATTYFQKNVPGIDEYSIGVAFRMQSLTTEFQVVRFAEGASVHALVKVLANGAIEVRGGNNLLLATSPAGLIQEGVYNYLEIQVVIHETAGLVTVNLDQTNIHALTSQDTQTGGAGVISEIRFAGSVDVVFFDDVYINNNIGVAPQNGIMGNTHMSIIPVGGDGTITNFQTLNPAIPLTQFSKVDEVPSDLDASFISSSVPLTQSLFTLTPLPIVLGNGAVYSVKVAALCKKDNEGSRGIIPLINPGVATALGTAKALGFTYSYVTSIFQQNPDTLADWLPSEIELTQIGVELQ